MSFPRYPEYKISGVEWLGEVPAHWEVVRLGFRYSIQLGKMLDTAKQTGRALRPYLRVADVQWGSINTHELPMMDFDEHDRQRYCLQAGDLLVNEGGSYPGRAAIWRGDLAECYYQKALHRLRPYQTGQEDPAYCLYMFRWATESGVFTAGGMETTIEHLPAEKLKGYRFPLPPLPEQTAIAQFLDRETAELDALVADQERLIALLKEKRQAVISHAVTRGLNPDAPRKDSGVEWLGEVPAHWEVVRLGAVFTSVSDTGNADLPVLSVSIHSGVSDREYPEEELDRKITRSEDRSKYIRVQPGDLVYNMMRAWQGGFGTVRVEGAVSPAYVVARPLRHFQTSLIEYLLRTPTGIEEMRRYSYGITDFRLRLYWDAFKCIRIPLPPLPEQHAIVEYLDRETAKLDGLVAEAEHAIALLRERRSALISAAVTGQIDVRGRATEED